jgi:hypothetical protein
MEKLSMEEKKRVLKYLREQLDVKIEALKQYEMPIKDLADRSPAETEAFLLRHDMYELRRHIQVIEML